MTDIKLSISIMSSPRAVVVGDVISTLKTARVFYDRGKCGPWYNSKRCWIHGARASGATHHLVIQDDAKLCAQFEETITSALKTVPDKPVSLYANRRAIEVAKESGADWAVIPDGAWGLGIILPKPLIYDFLKWEGRHIDPAFPHDDSRLALWAVETGNHFWCTVPSLIDHAGASHSTLGNSNSRRVARYYTGEAKLEWTKKRVNGPSSLNKEYYKYVKK